MKPLLKPKEVAQRLAVTHAHIYGLIKGKKLVAYKIGGAVRISEDDLEQYLEKRKLKLHP